MAIADRPVFCVLGLPFDALSLAEAERRVRSGIDRRERAILSTPNVNWVALARHDLDFRQSVLQSDCSVVDGMPLVWLARLMGLPIRERVSGSDLIDRLRRSDQPLRVFFFGGLGDVAERAAHALAVEAGALHAVGACNPGRGSIEEMSTPAMIEQINAAQPDLVVVSLGAQRGQAWILRNRARLDAPWVTHLGAVVNFFAGEVRRAPAFLARAGLEWLWRIAQEPALWRRYWSDGRVLVWLVCTRTLPMWIRQRLRATEPAVAPGGTLDDASGAGKARLHLRGDWGAEARVECRRLLAAAALHAPRVELDLTAVDGLDAAILGELLLFSGSQHARGGQLKVTAVSKRAKQAIFGHCAEFLLE